MKTKQLILAALVAVILAGSATRVHAFCIWDYCDDWDGCWFMC